MAHVKKKEMSAPLKLTSSIIKTVCELLREGVIPRFACMEADISIRSYHRWREDGKFLFEKRDEGEEPADAEGDMKMQFYIETEKALGTFDRFLGKEFTKHIPKSWQTIAWIRQHRFQDDYREASTDGGESGDTKGYTNGGGDTPTESEVQEAKQRLQEEVRRPA